MMTSDPFDFKGRTVFVAGGSSGINLGIADAFARHGANVAILSRSQERIDQALEQLRGHGGAAEGYSADVRDAAAVADALQQAHAKFGPIDVLVSGAAGNFLAPALGMSANGFQHRGRHRPARQLQRAARRHEFLRKPGRVGDQPLGAAGLRADAVPGARLRGQGGRRHADARAGDGVGAGRHARQLDRAGPDRGHRGHPPARAQRR